MKLVYLLVLLALPLSACETLKSAMVTAGDMTGNKKLSKAALEITPKQEYYLGRTLAAQSIAQAPVVSNQALDTYVNTLGHYLAIHSARPDTYRGYQFAVLRAKEPTAFSFPGGYVFVSSGMLEFLKSEDELAAVLAHELAHLRLQHPQKSIQAANRMSLLGDLAQAGLAQSGQASPESYKLFDGAVSTLLNKGFEQPQEIEADRYAVQILANAGFNRTALSDVLGRMKDNSTFTSRHPSNQERLDALSALGKAGGRSPASSSKRVERYKLAYDISYAENRRTLTSSKR